MKRNLLFHLYPRLNSCWPWHVQQLLEWSGAWNGRRIVVLALDGRTVREEDVRKQLEPFQAEILIRPNDLDLGETKYFIDNLLTIQSSSSDEATFYAHGKGVSRDGSDLRAVKLWSQAMYVLNLSRIDVVEKKLAAVPAVGAFRVQIPHSGSSWCFAGTFFWLKHSALFSRKWMSIERTRYGVEGYPGRIFKFEESVSLTPKVVEDRELPGWLYGRSGSGVTEGHIRLWQERLSREV